MKYNYIIFDFDGTISDTGEGVMKSAKYALDAFGIESDPWEKLTFFIGPPLIVSFMDKYKVSRETANELVVKFRERYKTIGVYESCLYKGIEQLLKSLKEQNVKIGIASSKPEEFIITLLHEYGIFEFFDAVCGVSFDADCESKADIIKRCMNLIDAKKESTLMVGDRFYDIDGANENKIDSVGVLYGFGSKEEFENSNATYIAEKAHDIESIANGFFEQTIESKTIFEGRILTLKHNKVRLTNGKITSREIVEHNGGVAIAALTDNEEMVLVKQFRSPYREIVLEVPAGKLEKNEEPYSAIVREFKEECGAEAKNIFDLGKLYPSSGYCGEIIHLYGATDLTFNTQNLDDDEFLDVVKIPLTKCVSMVMDGTIKDSKTIATILKMNELKREKKI